MRGSRSIFYASLLEGGGFQYSSPKVHGMTYSPEETSTSLKTNISPEDQRVEDSISS